MKLFSQDLFPFSQNWTFIFVHFQKFEKSLGEKNNNFLYGDFTKFLNYQEYISFFTSFIMPKNKKEGGYPTFLFLFSFLYFVFYIFLFIFFYFYKYIYLQPSVINFITD